MVHASNSKQVNSILQLNKPIILYNMMVHVNKEINE